MKKMILTVGASASGKNTWVDEFIDLLPEEEKYQWIILNRDDVRFELFTNGIRDWSKYRFNKKNEKAVSDVIDKKYTFAVENGLNIIVADTNLNPNIRKLWKNRAEEDSFEYEEKPFDVKWDVLVERTMNREAGISLSVLRSQYMKMLSYMGRKTYVPNNNLHDAVIVDVDGTVATMNGRKPYHWDKVLNDLPRKEIIHMVRGLYESGYRVIFLSGRDGSCYDDTELWLKRNTGFPFELYMRNANDNRPDYIVKEEIFWSIIEQNKWNIKLAIDDRPQVLRLWEEIGLQVVNVNTGLYNEF